MKKIFISLIFALCAFSVFAQNVKPYKVDLSKLPAVNEDKTATFDRATKTVTVTANEKLQYGGYRNVYLWLDRMDISGYNIARVKYKVIGDYGFHFILDYDDDKLDWDRDKNTYCPSYLNEMIIPLIPNQKKLKGISFQGTWNVPYQQFGIESVTLEKVPNPVKTDIYANDEPPVIDAAANGNFDDSISAWDFVQKLGVGFNYYPFSHHPIVEFGEDIYVAQHIRRPSKETIQFIKKTGFKTIRMQTNPEILMMDENYTINPLFMNELKRVIDLAIEEDMYVIICGPFAELMKEDDYRKKVKESVHYAGYSVSEEYGKESRALIKAIWIQYAKAFNNSYDEHLIFETLNEPIDCFHEHNFGEKTDCSVCKKDYAIMNEYNQIMLDAIRSTGGNNSKRFVMIAGLSSGYKNITTNLFKLPKDKAKDKLIPIFHIYPMGYTERPGQYYKKYYSDSIKKLIPEIFTTLDKVYFKKHIPVYLTETGAALTIPVLEKIAMMKDLMAEVTKKGRSCAVNIWSCDDYYNNLRDFDMWNIKWNAEPEYLNTIVYAAEGKEYPLSEDFLKKNEVIVPSIVGKNLLAEPFEIKNWDVSYRIDPELLVRSVPPKYKLEFTVERKDSNALLQVGFSDNNGNWHEIVKEKNVSVKGAAIQDGWCIKVTNEVFTVSIDEKLAAALEASQGIVLNGENLIIKSVKVLE